MRKKTTDQCKMRDDLTAHHLNASRAEKDQGREKEVIAGVRESRSAIRLHMPRLIRKHAVFSLAVMKPCKRPADRLDLEASIKSRANGPVPSQPVQPSPVQSLSRYEPSLELPARPRLAANNHCGDLGSYWEQSIPLSVAITGGRACIFPLRSRSGIARPEHLHHRPQAYVYLFHRIGFFRGERL